MRKGVECYCHVCTHSGHAGVALSEPPPQEEDLRETGEAEDGALDDGEPEHLAGGDVRN